MNYEEALAPQLGKPTVFGDLDVITEAVPCNYMQPTKASIAAQQDMGAVARKRKASRNNEFSSPMKRPGTANVTSSSMGAG